MTTRLSPPRLARLAGAVGAGLLAVFGWGASSCAPSGFQDPSLIQNGVRILASSATAPYANPGDTVGLSVLAFDGRTDAQRGLNPEPMHLYWLTTLCVNPLQDAYYACFPQVAAEFAPFESDAGPSTQADGSMDLDGGASGETGPDADVGASDAGATEDSAPDAGASEDGDADDAVDATLDAEGNAVDGSSASAPLMTPLVSRIDFSVPSGIIIPRVGTPSYGLLIKFNIACAGHLQLLPIASNNQNPQQLPVGCFDSTGQMLGPESYVFGYTRVYVYAPDGGPGTVNHNPVITALDTPQLPESDGALPLIPPETIGVDGGEGPPNLTAAGTFIAPLCATGDNCFHPSIGPVVPPSSWEVAANGVHEELWAEYFATFGSFNATSRLLYDPVAGAIANPDTQFQPPIGQPANQTTGLLWIVVHDNRGGAAWVTVPVQLQ